MYTSFVGWQGGIRKKLTSSGSNDSVSSSSRTGSLPIIGVSSDISSTEEMV